MCIRDRIIGLIHRDYQGKKIFMLAPCGYVPTGHYKELFEQVRKKGYLYVRVDGEDVYKRQTFTSWEPI